MPGGKRGTERSALEMLTRSHLRLRAVLTELRAALREHDHQVIDDSLAFLRGPARRHFRDEEQSIFPRLSQLGQEETIERLLADHADHELAFSELETLYRTGSYQQADALAGELEAAVNDHSELEEAALWPIIAQLSPDELSAACDEMRSRRKKTRRH